MPDLSSCDLRLQRADEHLATLHAKRRAFFDEEERRVVGYFDRETSEYVFRVGGNAPEPCIGLVLSEFAHHLRATLDNLLWQLVLLRGAHGTRHTQFPIYETREGYRGNAPRVLRGVSTDDRALIEWLQPYNTRPQAPQFDALALLGWLNNWDKHRILHLGCAFVRRSRSYDSEFLDWTPVIVSDISYAGTMFFGTGTASKDRTELLRVAVTPSGNHPEMEMKGDQPIDISLSDSEHMLIIADLVAIRTAVADVVDRFRPRFAI